jgi:outer membrane protein OmpA-like peptidoglycan-associated protein
MHMHKTLVVAALTAAVTMVGCTTNPYTGEQQGSKAGYGAAIGTAIGAVAGLAMGHDAKSRRRGALIGAGVGGLSGAGVGYYMDQQEAELRKQLQGSGVSVTRQGDSIVLNMPGNITFKTASSDLNPGFLNVLDSVALVAKKYDKQIVSVEGHTDNVGASDYNQKLSEQRASSVATYLSGRGVPPNRLIAIGAGESQPIASNDSDAGRSQNRRVEIHLEPLKANG